MKRGQKSQTGKIFITHMVDTGLISTTSKQVLKHQLKKRPIPREKWEKIMQRKFTKKP